VIKEVMRALMDVTVWGYALVLGALVLSLLSYLNVSDLINVHGNFSVL